MNNTSKGREESILFDDKKNITHHSVIGENNSRGSFYKLNDYNTTIAVLEAISDPIFILDVEGKIRYANRSSLDLLNIKIKDLIGKLIDDILIDDVYDSNVNLTDKNKKLIERISSGVFDNIEALLVGNSVAVPVLVSFSAIYDSDNEVRYIIVTAKNISQRKSLENELKQQQVLAISRNRLKLLGELSIGLLHQLCQPLSSLKLRVELLCSHLQNNKNVSEDLWGNIKEVKELLDRLTESIYKIRTFTHQTENDNLSLVNISEVLDRAESMTFYDLKCNSILLEIQKENNIPNIVANPLTLEQVFVNLIANSRDAFLELMNSDDGRVPEQKKIEIVVKSIKDKWVEIFVRDNAGGIKEEILDRIFDPFFTTKEPGTNTGVGLSISKSIIESLGGDIKVNSKENIGTEFKIRIPLTHEKDEVQLENLVEMLQT